MASHDVTIYGAGIFGLTCAWALAERGAHVQIIDPAGPGGGASGGVVGALAPHVPEKWNDVKALQFESLISAPDFWAEIEDRSRRDSGYARTGRLQPIADDAALARARERTESAGALWGAEATWRIIPAEKAGSWAPLSPTSWLIHDTLSARLNPLAACDALAEALRVRGVPVHAGGTSVGRVLWATGAAGLADLTASLGRPIGTGIKGQAALLAHSCPQAPQLFADSLHIVPHADGTTAIGSTTERDFTDPFATDLQLDDVVARARAVCPLLRDAPVLRRWAGLRPRAASRAPILGAWPGRPGHFVANGGFKIGFGVAHGVARLMADLVLEGHDAIPAAFRLDALTG